MGQKMILQQEAFKAAPVVLHIILLITTEYLKVISNPPVKHGKVCLNGQHYSCEIYFLISASDWDHLQMDIL